MPMKLNVGVSREVARPDFSSEAPSGNPELTSAAALMERDLPGHHSQIRLAKLIAARAVNNELHRLQALTDCKAEVPAWKSGRGTTANGSTIEDRNGLSGQFEEAPSRGRKPAQSSQVKAILAITRNATRKLIWADC